MKPAEMLEDILYNVPHGSMEVEEALETIEVEINLSWRESKGGK